MAATTNTPTAVATRSADEVRDARQRQEKVAELVRTSTAGIANAMLTKAVVHAHSYTSGKLRDECATLAAERDAAKAQATEHIRALVDAMERADEHDDFSEVIDRLESSRLNATATLQTTVRLFTKAVDLAERVAAELRPIGPKLEREAAVVVADVKAELAAMGSGIEAQVGYGKNAHAAEHQFDHAARMNTRSRAALTKAAQAKGEYDAAVERVNIVRAGLQEAKTTLRKLVESQIRKV